MTTGTTTITEKFVDLSHGRTRYYEAGSGYPTILLHGAQYSGGADTWLHNVPALAAHVRVLVPDALNWGPGDSFDQEFSFAYLVDQVREFMDALGIEKANIIGHSMGGWTATLFGYESPDRVNKLVLSDAGGTATRALQGMVNFKAPDEEQIRTQVSRRLGSVTLPEGFTVDGLLAQHLTVDLVPEHADSYGKVMKHMTTMDHRARYNTVRRLKHIKAQTLVTWGAQDTTNDPELGRELAAGIPGAKLVMFEGAGHQVPTEKPAEWEAAVIEFLKS